MDCIFCKIIKGEIPCYKIYENEYILSFLDIANDVEGHTLVIPKKHFKNILDCDEKYLNEIINAIQLISNHYVNHCGYDGINVLNNNEVSAEQSVLHLHFHIIPRKNDDENKIYPQFKPHNAILEQTYTKLKIN